MRTSYKIKSNVNSSQWLWKRFARIPQSLASTKLRLTRAARLLQRGVVRTATDFDRKSNETAIPPSEDAEIFDNAEESSR